MNSQNCHCNDNYQGRLSAGGSHSGGSDLVAARHQFAWRNALASLASPAIRLHRLRNLRAQIIHDALGDGRDCDEAETTAKDA